MMETSLHVPHTIQVELAQAQGLTVISMAWLLHVLILPTSPTLLFPQQQRMEADQEEVVVEEAAEGAIMVLLLRSLEVGWYSARRLLSELLSFNWF